MGRTSKNIYNRYPREDLERAIQSVKDGMSCARAARQYNIPRKTLVDHVSGRSTLQRRAGKEQNIPAEIENKIVDQVIAAADAGFPLTKQQCLLKMGAVVKKLALTTQFRDGVPGKDYWLLLKERRPDLVIRTPENCATNELNMMTRPVVDAYFNGLETLLDHLNIRDKPQLIWNCDETGLQFSPDSSKVIAQRGMRSLVARCSPSKESITTLVCINAAGTAMPPLCDMKGKTVRSVQSFAVQDAPDGTIWTYQASGWMNDEIGVQWFRQVFLPNCGDQRPQLLILDSHHSHEVLDMLEDAKRENIHVLALPPHMTHILQPLDRVVFKPFKTAYKRFCTEFMASSPGRTINKASWPGLLNKTWVATMKPELLRKSFEATGIFPVDRTRIPSSVFLPSEATAASILDQSNLDLSSPQHQEQEVEIEHQEVEEPITISMDEAADNGQLDNENTEMDTDLNLSIQIQDLSDIAFLHGMTINVDGEEMAIDTILDLEELEPTTATSSSSMSSSSPPSSSHTHAPLANWNEEITSILGFTSPTPNTKKSRAIPSHRLLTCKETLDEKRAALEQKERLEKEKQERKEKAEKRKLEKAQKNAPKK